MCKNIINNKCLYFDSLVTVLDAPVGIILCRPASRDAWASIHLL